MDADQENVDMFADAIANVRCDAMAELIDGSANISNKRRRKKGMSR